MATFAAFTPIACSNGDDNTEQSLPTFVPTSVVIVTTSQVTTTTLPPIDPALVDDCVEYIKFGAYTHNPMLAAMWDAAGQDEVVLRANCVSLGRIDPGGLRALSDGWAQVQQLLSTTSTTSTTIAPPRTPRTTLPPATDVPVEETVPDTTPESTTETTVDPTATTLEPAPP